MAIIFVVYIIMAQIGRSLFVAPAVIQPAAGIALAALVLEGIMLWPAIVAASAVNTLINGVPPIVALGNVIAHTLHAVIGAYVLRLVGFDPVFRRVRDMFAFIFVALTASMLVPSISLLGIYFNNFLTDPDWPIRATWVSWWSGIMIGDLVLASVLIRSLSKKYFARSRLDMLELLAAFTFLGITSYFLYWTPMSQQTSGIILLAYLLPFVWFSLRLGVRFTLIAFLVTCVIGLLGALYGNVPSESPLPRRIITLEFFFATLAVIFYLFTAVVEERKRATKELNTQLDRVKGLLDKVQAEDKAKNEFLAIFSHELRNPLAPIVSSLELVKLRLRRMQPHDIELNESIGIIDDRVHTIVRLLDDLLDISRISQKKLNLRRERVDVRDTIDHALQSVQLLAAERNITLIKHLPEHDVILDADPVRLEQMFSNLLNNAKKYTNPGGSVTVSVHTERDNAIISIKDTGIGIEPHLLSRIFEPFLQLDTGHRSAGINEGLGIGLSLTKQLAEMHGGTIEAKSDGRGLGSEFIVCFPLATETSSAARTAAVPQEPRDVLPRTVLVVDDNETAARSLGRLLETLGHTLVYAENGIDALARARDVRPDVVVLDIGLPDFSGYEVAERLRDGGYTGTLIALTGYGQDEDKQRALDAGFNYHLTKPIALADLQMLLFKT